MMSATTADMRR
ncbi:hypothetical protein AZE42_09401 [Rhizopogon vesiculosus]|uniref:Uncharacterized protein n=1 Tax=Rhizopogon vesiculosus TaxID=180088 RepID=A0A1J8Q3V8_9AGAM|nr:hypothetical protein AZE42_09401 [Rhizopogon vesiculosus]